MRVMSERRETSRRRAVLAFALTLCSACTDPATCDEACATSSGDRASSACSTPRGSSVLIDNFGGQVFPFIPSQTADGVLIAPAAFSWKAPAKTEFTVCAFFVEMPRFVCGSMENFDSAVAYYDEHRLADGDAREGTFDLASAHARLIDTERTFWGAGCWAYSLTKVIGATVLREIALEQAPPSELALLSDTCSNADAPCYAPDAHRPGKCVQGACRAHCDALLGCPSGTTCSAAASCE